MDPRLTYRDHSLYLEDVPLEEVAERVGTPCYVYSATSILERYRTYDEAFGSLPHLICYAVKANGNVAILKLLAEAGAGFDIVSGGELYRVLVAGADPARVVFSGVGKTAEEIEYALEAGIHSFNCESLGELELVNALAARRGRKARVAIRVNPDIGADTHPYIATGLREHKFGFDILSAELAYEHTRHLPYLLPQGLSCHVGSQLLDVDPIIEAVDVMRELALRLRSRGFDIRYIDLGGGLGIRYRPEDQPPDVASFIRQVRHRLEGEDFEVIIEPGRSIVGEGGVLLTRVLYRKRTGQKEFVVVDASMTDLIRPALYGSYHEILPVRESRERGSIVADVVGPVCETGDFLARDRPIANVLPGDFLAICSAGAYGFVLASNYNARPRPPEVLVRGGTWKIVRRRETFEDLVRPELECGALG